MTESFCQICKQVFDGYTTTIQLSDDKDHLFISGHEKCMNEIFEKIKSLKDLHKLSNAKVLKQINLKLE